VPAAAEPVTPCYGLRMSIVITKKPLDVVQPVTETAIFGLG
jgi:hypothetical protein